MSLRNILGKKLGFYKMLSNYRTIEIRVQTRKIGYKKKFAVGDDLLLTKILNFYEKRRFIPKTQLALNSCIFPYSRHDNRCLNCCYRKICPNL